MNSVTARTSAPLPVWSGRSKQRNWLFVGLVISLALHAVLCFFFYQTGFQPTAPLGLEKRPPPTFKVKSVETAPKPLDQAAASSTTEAAKPNPDQTDVQLPDDQKSFDKLLQDARAVEAAGAFSVVLEIVAADTARRITDAIGIPTIGIGSGEHCDGQILVTHDLIGLYPWFTPKFVSPEVHVAEEIRRAARIFIDRTRGSVC